MQERRDEIYTRCVAPHQYDLKGLALVLGVINMGSHHVEGVGGERVCVSEKKKKSKSPYRLFRKNHC